MNPNAQKMIELQTAVLRLARNTEKLSEQVLDAEITAKSKAEQQVSPHLQEIPDLYQALIIVSNAVELIASSRVPEKVGGLDGRKSVLGCACTRFYTSCSHKTSVSRMRAHRSEIDAIYSPSA